MVALFRRYWDGLVSYDGGVAILMMDALLIIPLIMAAFFYPVEVAVAVGALLLVTVVAYESYVFWRRRHLPRVRL
jgi:uncharacterized membrane protein YfcA